MNEYQNEKWSIIGTSECRNNIMSLKDKKNHNPDVETSQISKYQSIVVVCSFLCFFLLLLLLFPICLEQKHGNLCG